MCHLVNRTAIHILSQNHRIRDKMLHACTSRDATCTARQGRIVQTQNFIFGRFSNFYFYPNGTWTHPPTSKLFLDFWNFFNFAKPLRTNSGKTTKRLGTKFGTHLQIHLGIDIGPTPNKLPLSSHKGDLRGQTFKSLGKLSND